MKNISNFIVIIVLLISVSGSAQNQSIDRLIEQIDNKEAYIVMLKTMSPRIKSEAGFQLIRIGKSASPYLIRILDQQNKSIIAHFILSEIWKKSWQEEICCNVETDGRVEIITINRLRVIIDNNQLSATPADMIQNKTYWKKLCAVNAGFASKNN